MIKGLELLLHHWSLSVYLLSVVYIIFINIYIHIFIYLYTDANIIWKKTLNWICAVKLKIWNYMCVLEISRRCQSWVIEGQSWSSKPLTDMFVTFLWGQTRICRASIFGVLRSSILTKDCLTDWLRVLLLFEAISSSLYEPLHVPISQMESIALIYAQILMRKCCYLLLARQHPLLAGWARTALFVVWRFWPRSIAAPRKLWPVTCAKRLVFWFVRDCESVCFCGWPPFIAFKCPYTTQNMSTSLDTYMYLLTWLKQLI